jgi:hypothetical protein
VLAPLGSGVAGQPSAMATRPDGPCDDRSVTTVYRTKAEVPPEPPHLRILSMLHRLRPMRRDLDDAPPCCVPISSEPIWNQLEPHSGEAPPRPLPRDHARSARATPPALTALVALFVVGCALAVGSVAYHRYQYAAQSSEAAMVIQSLRAAQEAHRSGTLGYLGCGQCEGAACDQVQGSLLARYPHAVPDGKKWAWSSPAHPDFGCWQHLRVQIDEPVRYTYAVVAGPPGVSPPPIPGLAEQPAWPMPTEPWYVIQAVGDLDGDGVRSIVVGSSFTNEVLAQNQGE